MSKTLPINLNPPICTYTHHGFIQSIISSEDKVNYDENKEIAIINVLQYDQFSWLSQLDKLSYTMRPGNTMFFYGNKWNIDLNAAFWRKCKYNDRIDITIQKQQYNNVWASIIIFFARNHSNTMTDIDSSYEFQFGNYSKDGIFYRVKTEPHIVLSSNSVFPKTISLIKNGHNLILHYGQCIEKINLPTNLTLDRIGFAINLGCNSYYEWTFSNYINFYINTKNSMPIDYLCNPHKNWVTHTYNYFIDYSSETLESIKHLGFTTLEYIKKMIDLNHYVETLINDSIHRHIHDFNHSYFHQDLIYGYDDSSEVLYMLYINRGKLTSTTMTYKDFASNENYLASRILYVYKYNPGYEVFKLSKDHLFQKYNDYHESKNTLLPEPYLNESYSYGIRSLELLYSSEGFEHLMSDIRISHLLYEHSICNKNRIEYIYSKKILSLSIYSQLKNNLEMQCTDSLIIRNSILKYQLNGNSNQLTIKERLIKFVENEEKNIQQILYHLK